MSTYFRTRHTSQVFLQVADNQEQIFYNIPKIAKACMIKRSIIMLCKINREVLFDMRSDVDEFELHPRQEEGEDNAAFVD
ncbi:hypothetical protein MASR2M69_14280 [Bacteroidota bacterium]